MGTARKSHASSLSRSFRAMWAGTCRCAPINSVSSSGPHVAMEPPDGDTENLDTVKALAEKLKLQTRRPSYLEWKESLQKRPWSGDKSPGDGPLPAAQSVCGFRTVDDALEWLRSELKEMQLQDNRLARQLIGLRGEIHRLKVEQVCHRHKEMLDDATYELEECEEESDLLCDIPMKAAFALSTPLKHLGLTKMNINSRRFSLC